MGRAAGFYPARCRIIAGAFHDLGSVAQLEAQPVLTRKVRGSTPLGPTTRRVKNSIGKSSSGRTRDSDSRYRGSNPLFPATLAPLLGHRSLTTSYSFQGRPMVGSRLFTEPERVRFLPLEPTSASWRRQRTAWMCLPMQLHGGAVLS